MIRPRRFAVLLAVALTTAACGSPTPSSSPSPSASAVASAAPSATAAPSAAATGSVRPSRTYAEINAQVQAIRGLDEKTPIEPDIVSPAELATVIRASFDHDYPPDQVAADQALYRALGLIGPDVKLADVFVDLLESQVAGLYDPVAKKLYVVSKAGGVGPVEQVFSSHEYDHALQDQHFGLQRLQEGLRGQSDTLLAHQALVEGDAYVLMTYWLQQNLDASEIQQVIAASGDPEALAALQRIPPIVQAQILFAATQGTQFVLGQQIAGGWPVIDKDFAEPPATTEQVLHPEKYDAREPAVVVPLPTGLATKMGAGWSVATEDTFGEHQIGIWLAAAPDAAAGWGGDRLTLLQGPRNAWALAWRTAWDTAADAADFETAAAKAVAKAGGPGQVLPGEGGTTRWVVIGSDAAALGKIAGILGLAG
jgi:hypothetical protein